MSRRYREYYDDSDSDSDVPRSGRGSRSGASRKGSDYLRGRKEPSRPWTQEESEWLINVVSKTSTNIDNINWQDIAKQVPGRTGKQCREKWKNDLRPNICKDPWSLKEEYVLAMAHSLHGNRWSEVAKYLPTRPENTIKNRWYATNRAKAEVKIRTFLWLYSDLIDRQSYPAGPEAIDKARELYRQLPDVVPLEEFEVPVDFYIRSGEDGDIPAALDTRPEIKIIGRGKAKAPGAVAAAATSGGSGSGSGGSAAAAAASGGSAPAAVTRSTRAGTRATRGVQSGAVTAATAAVAMTTASPSRAVTTGATALIGRGRGLGAGGGTGSGGGHSEGDANCYVKVGIGGSISVADLQPATGPIKTPARKRKATGAAAADGGAGGAVYSPPAHTAKVVKHETEAATMEVLGGVVLGGIGIGIGGGDACATVNTTVRVKQEQARGGASAAAAAASASPATSATALAGPGLQQQQPPPLPASMLRGGNGGGGGNGGAGGLSTVDPDLLWQTATETFIEGMAVPRGRRGSSSRLLAGGSLQGRAGNSSGGVPGATTTTTTTSSIFGPASHDPHDPLQSQLDLMQLGGVGSLPCLLGDAGGNSGAGPEHDPDLMALADGFDLASLAALMDGQEVHCEALSTNDAQEAMAGLAADVLSQMPDSSAAHHPHQLYHHHHHHFHHEPPPHPFSHAQHTITTPPPQQQLHASQHPQALYHHPHHPQHQLLAHANRLTTSLGSASSFGSPGPRPQQMSHGSFQQQQQQQAAAAGTPPPLLHTNESGCQLSMPLPQRGSLPLPPMPAMMNPCPTTHQSPASLSQGQPQTPTQNQQQQQQQQQQQLYQQQMEQQQQQQQQQAFQATHDGAGYMGYNSPTPAAAAVRRLQAGMVRTMPPPLVHMSYDSPSYMPPPPHLASAAPSPGGVVHPGVPGSRGMHPASAASAMTHGSPASVKYAMPPYAGGPPPPGVPYGIAGPPPPYMVPMGVRGVYYKLPPGSRPVPRGMMPYPPGPYGMPVYPPHAYLDGMPPPPPAHQHLQQQQHMMGSGGALEGSAQTMPPPQGPPSAAMMDGPCGSPAGADATTAGEMSASPAGMPVLKTEM